jgi:hypothetical protein
MGIGAVSRRDWHDAAAYRHLEAIDRAGLMWEWLRRDSGYIAWQAQASAVTGGLAPCQPDRDPLRWGVHFR